MSDDVMPEAIPRDPTSARQQSWRQTKTVQSSR